MIGAFADVFGSDDAVSCAHAYVGEPTRGTGGEGGPSRYADRFNKCEGGSEQ